LRDLHQPILPAKLHRVIAEHLRDVVEDLVRVLDLVEGEWRRAQRETVEEDRLNPLVLRETGDVRAALLRRVGVVAMVAVSEIIPG